MEEQHNNQPETQSQASSKQSSSKITLVIIVALIAIALAAYFIVGRTDQSSLFGGAASETIVVATVNGEPIHNDDLNMSVRQITATAQAQGIDITSEDAQTEIEGRALDVLINTELLLQEAEAKEITVTNETVENRLTQITTELGGEEALQARLDELDIDAATLKTDIENELVIQILLDQVFSEEDVTVSEEEIAEAYELAGGESSGFEIDEVREQLRLNVQTAKEQAILDGFLGGLRADAEIEKVQ